MIAKCTESEAEVLSYYLFIYVLTSIYLFRLLQVLVAAFGLLVVACMWDLVPRPGIEHWPPVLGAWSLTQWTTREVPELLFLS